MVLNLQIHNKLFIYLVNISYVMQVHVGSVGVVRQLSMQQKQLCMIFTHESYLFLYVNV